MIEVVGVHDLWFVRLTKFHKGGSTMKVREFRCNICCDNGEYCKLIQPEELCPPVRCPSLRNAEGFEDAGWVEKLSGREALRMREKNLNKAIKKLISSLEDIQTGLGEI